MYVSHKATPFTLSYCTLLTALALTVWILLRLVLSVHNGWHQIEFPELFGALILGVWFDIATWFYWLAPVMLVSSLLPSRWLHSPWQNKIRWFLAFLLLFIFLFDAVAEFIFWQEFNTRFNFIAVDYLVYTHEVIGNIRESYPVPLIVLAIASFDIAFLFLLSKKIKIAAPSPSRNKRILKLVLAFLLPLLSYVCVSVEQMQFSQNAYANELAGNGLFSFAAAFRRNELDYDKFYRTIPQSIADKQLLASGVRRLPLSKSLISDHNKTETSVLGPLKRRPKNVVLIMVESLSADYVGIYGNKENLTPNFDRIAGEGLVFDKVFAAGTRTVRGLDALTIAIPPIPGQAIVHRPKSDHLATLGEFLEAQHFSTFFIYGGYGAFDSMNTYFKGNDYNVIDRTDFDKSSIQTENIWGVDDESLFDNALQVIDGNVMPSRPFFAHIMTTSNHRPFTFPEGKIDLPSGNRKGAVKYTDYALGKFIEKARTKAWFKDTLFVIVADHCASAAGKTKLPVDRYHIPLLFYAPDLLPAGHYSRMVSQIDIVPTLLDILGVKGSWHFFGQSMFQAQHEKRDARAFISNYQQLGYYKNDLLIILSPKHKAEAYHVNPMTLESTPTAMNHTLLNEAIAYYQTAARAYKLGELKETANPN